MIRGSTYFKPRLVSSAEPSGAHTGVFTPEQAQQFRTLILPHLDAAYGLARYLARDPTAAEDIVQNAFLRAFKAFPQFQGQAPKAWLFAIVRNCALYWIKTHHRPNVSLDAAESRDHDAGEEREGCGLRRCRKQGGHRRRRALVDIRRPHVERHG